MRHQPFKVLKDFCVKGKTSLSSFGTARYSYRVWVMYSILSNFYEKRNKTGNTVVDFEKERNAAVKKFISDIFPLMIIFYTYLEKTDHLTEKHKQIICEAVRQLHTNFFKNTDTITEVEKYIKSLLQNKFSKRMLKDCIFLFYDYLKELNFGNGKINYNEIDKKFSIIKKEIDDSHEFNCLPPTMERPKKIIGETAANFIQEKEVVRLSGLSRSSLRRLIKNGTLTYINGWGYDKRILNQYLLSSEKIKLSKSVLASKIVTQDMGKLLTASESSKILYPRLSKEVAMRYLNRLKSQNKISYYQLGKKKFYYFESEINSIK